MTQGETVTGPAKIASAILVVGGMFGALGGVIAMSDSASGAWGPVIVGVGVGELLAGIGAWRGSDSGRSVGIIFALVGVLLGLYWLLLPFSGVEGMLVAVISGYVAVVFTFRWKKRQAPSELSGVPARSVWPRSDAPTGGVANTGSPASTSVSGPPLGGPIEPAPGAELTELAEDLRRWAHGAGSETRAPSAESNSAPVTTATRSEEREPWPQAAAVADRDLLVPAASPVSLAPWYKTSPLYRGLLLAVAVVLLLYLLATGLNGARAYAGPPAGEIWFGSEWDRTTWAVTNRITSTNVHAMIAVVLQTRRRVQSGLLGFAEGGHHSSIAIGSRDGTGFEGLVWADFVSVGAQCGSIGLCTVTLSDPSGELATGTIEVTP